MILIPEKAFEKFSKEIDNVKLDSLRICPSKRGIQVCLSKEEAQFLCHIKYLKPIWHDLMTQCKKVPNLKVNKSFYKETPPTQSLKAQSVTVFVKSPWANK